MSSVAVVQQSSMSFNLVTNSTGARFYFFSFWAGECWVDSCFLLHDGDCGDSTSVVCSVNVLQVHLHRLEYHV